MLVVVDAWEEGVVRCGIVLQVPVHARAEVGLLMSAKSRESFASTLGG
jgi:hypothetical protein